MGANIASTIKERRKNSGKTVKDVVAELAKVGVNVSDKTIYGWESGHRQPDADALVELCRILGIDSFAEFLDDAEPTKIYKPKPRTDPAAAAALFESLPEGRREAAMEYMEALRLIEETQSGETALSEKSA